MIKLALGSDLHLEFGSIDPVNTHDAEVLILSGDICTAVDLEHTDTILSSGRRDRFLDFFADCSGNFDHVVYVMGNHEHYHGDFATSAQTIKTALAQYENVHVLDKEVWHYKNLVFVGGTLWTNMNSGDADTMRHVQNSMNDFRICKNSNRMVSYRSQDLVQESQKGQAIFHQRPDKFSPEDAVADHEAMLAAIETAYAELPDRARMVVVGHHAPSLQSIHSQYAGQRLMNGGYSSDLDQFVLDHPRICLWTHGHTHHEFDYMIGATRIVCNPRGYVGYEARADQFSLQYIDV
jgi:hypothetical protein